jgi:hypothetical protein
VYGPISGFCDSGDEFWGPKEQRVSFLQINECLYGVSYVP